MRIIGYTYEADVHCPACAAQRFGHTPDNGFFDVEFNLNPVLTRSYMKHGTFTSYSTHGETQLDERMIPIDQIDREGNTIGVIFDISEDAQTLTHCGDCHEEL